MTRTSSAEAGRVVVVDALSTRHARLARATLTATFEAGVHALVGGPRDGGPLLLSVIAGRALVRSGRVRVLGEAPGSHAIRRRVGWVPSAPSLPEAMRVHEVMALAAVLRGEAAAPTVERLAALGLEALALRRVRSLTLEERRAVALAEALTSTVVRVLLLEEPLVAVDPRAAARVV